MTVLRGADLLPLGRGAVGIKRLGCLGGRDGAEWCRKALDAVEPGLFFDATCTWERQEVEKGEYSIKLRFQVLGNNCGKLDMFREAVRCQAESHVESLVPPPFLVEGVTLPCVQKRDAWRCELERKSCCNIKLLDDRAALLVTSDGSHSQKEITEILMRIAGPEPTFNVQVSLPRSVLRPQHQLPAPIKGVAHKHNIECQLHAASRKGKQGSVTCEIRGWPTPWALPQKCEMILELLAERMEAAAQAVAAAATSAQGDDYSSSDEEYDLSNEHVMAVACDGAATATKKGKQRKFQNRLKGPAVKPLAPQPQGPQLFSVCLIIDEVKERQIIERSKALKQHAGKRQMWKKGKQALRTNEREHKEHQQKCY